jgi:signal transduction histidine kinase
VIRELKKRDEKIVSINNELNRLIYKASHDLLGPIKTIQGLIALGKKEDEVKNYYQYLNLIAATTFKLDQALVNLLKVITIKDPCDYTPIVWEFLISHAENTAQKRVEGRKLCTHTKANIKTEFRSDAALLQMILEELFVNSMQYNLNNDVCVEVDITESQNRLILKITDNGIGVRADEKDRIFEMFFKNAKSRGSGLGLYIVKTAVEKLGGSIHAESQTNAGTRLVLSFPLTTKTE